MKNFWRHLKTITHHRHLVMRGCFRVGLYRRGLLHDLSKYSPEEFWAGVKYYQGSRSPNTAEREDKGYSAAWMHHKGRNKHHFEYWTDLRLDTKTYGPVDMGEQVLAIDAVNEILIVRESGSGYRGVLAIAKDPSRLSVEMASSLGSYGQLSGDIASQHNGVLAMAASIRTENSRALAA